MSVTNSVTEQAVQSVDCTAIFCFLNLVNEVLVFLATIAPLGTLIVLCGSAYAAYLGIQSAREMGRKKATLDLLERANSNQYYQKIDKAFRDIKKDAQGFVQLTEATNPHLIEQRSMVIDFLNHYEFIAVGIETGILDEELVKSYMRSVLVKDYFASADFISKLKQPSSSSSATTSPASWEKYEQLAKRWAIPTDKPGQNKLL